MSVLKKRSAEEEPDVFKEMEKALDEYLYFELDIAYTVERGSVDGSARMRHTTFTTRGGDTFTITPSHGHRRKGTRGGVMISHNGMKPIVVESAEEIGEYVEEHLSEHARALLTIAENNRMWLADKDAAEDMYKDVAESTQTSPEYVKRIRKLPQWWLNDQGVGAMAGDEYTHGYPEQYLNRLRERVLEEKHRDEAARRRRGHPHFFY
jgi:hypothetical protein